MARHGWVASLCLACTVAVLSFATPVAASSTSPSPSPTPSPSPSVGTRPDIGGASGKSSSDFGSEAPRGAATHRYASAQRRFAASIVVQPDAVAVLRATRVTGALPATAPDGTVVTLQVLHATGWVAQATVTASDAGDYAFDYRPTLGPTVRLRVVAQWPGGAAVSPEAVVTVTMVLDPVVSGPLTRADVPYSYRSGCPVGPSGLRRITMNHYDYSGTVRRGTLIVSAGSVADLLKVFGAAFAARFPIKRMVPSDAYYARGTRSPSASDVAAMNDGNTSAFNCRPVVGNPYRMSAHSYGHAIDINTFENPYVTSGHVYPSGARGYLVRSPYRTGMLLSGGPVAKTMAAVGWPWGARWSHPDYQHFSSTGG